MLARRLAEALGDVAEAAGIRDDGTEVAYESEQLLSEPLAWFLCHPNWPSGLASENVPIELSISMGGDGTPWLRYSVDCADHRMGLGGNWPRYLREATRLASGVGVPPSVVWQLLASVLDGSPPLDRSRLYHGVGYAGGGAKRVSLYFSTAWLTYPNFRERFPDLVEPVGQAIDRWGSPRPLCFDGLAYDLTGQEPAHRTKLYQWLGCDVPSPLNELAGRHPDLVAAGVLFNHYFSSNPPHTLSRSLLLQWSLLPPRMSCNQKLFFECTRWGWGNPRAYRELLSLLNNRFGMNLGPLYAMIAVFANYKILIRPTFLAIGPGPAHPSITFYFRPVLAEPLRSASTSMVMGPMPDSFARNPVGLLEHMTRTATDFLLREKRSDDYWMDFALPIGPSDAWVTAYITAILSRMSGLHVELDRPARILRTWFRPNLGWGENGNAPTDADSTALALLTLKRLDRPIPDGASDILMRYRLHKGGYCHDLNSDVDDEHGTGAPEITGIALLAMLEIGLADSAVINGCVENVLALQHRRAGGTHSGGRMTSSQLAGSCMR